MTIYIWPENLLAWSFFSDQCRTQWRIGMSGPTGLDYAAVLRCIDELDLDSTARRDLFSDVRAMERAALNSMRSKDG